jgi:hypothetical protein|uniref:Uncharacterized protein n=1 Tax=Myoviridae sp. ctrCp2 TaxID=2825179 RepID=A0A8S5P0G1_9CAUD|nr:MAG TPA: hypothetical protein [Myoviridae sp. ctrCp2]
MYGAVIPSYHSKSEGEGKKTGQKVIKADDPKSKEEVRQFFETCD